MAKVCGSGTWFIWRVSHSKPPFEMLMQKAILTSLSSDVKL